MNKIAEKELFKFRLIWHEAYILCGFGVPVNHINKIGLTPDVLFIKWSKRLIQCDSNVTTFTNTYTKTIHFLSNRLTDHKASITKQKMDKFPSTSLDHIKINSDWLLIWMCVELLRNPKMREKYGLEEKASDTKLFRNQIATVDYLHRLTVLVLFAFHIIEYPDPTKRPQFIDISPDDTVTPTCAQIELLAEYAYTGLGINRQMGFEEHLKKMISPEVLHYSSKLAYRDHLYHIIDVCLLGHLLLLVSNSNNLLTSSRNKTNHWLFGEIKKQYLNEYIETRLKQWYIAALYHDYGYTLRIISDSFDYLKILESSEIKMYREIIEKGISEARSAFDEEFKKNNKAWSEQLIEKESAAKDHASVSAVHTRDRIRSMKNGVDQDSGTQESLDAIFSHESYSRDINIKTEPISFLLLLCDRLEEWGRPRIDICNLTTGFVSALRFEEPFLPETFTTARYLTANLQISLDQKSLAWDIKLIPSKKEKAFIFHLIHSPADSEFSAEVVPGWIKLCSDFGKLTHLNELGLDYIYINSFHPRSSRLNKFFWHATEMELLHAYAGTEKGAFTHELLNHIKTTEVDQNQPLDISVPYQYKHYQNENGEYEEFIQVIKDWSISPWEHRMPRWLAHLPDDYYKDFSDWKKQLLISDNL